MRHHVTDIPIAPWQSSLLIGMGVVALVLFIAFIILLCINSKNANLRRKIDGAIFFSLIGALVGVGIALSLAIVFIVEGELGFKLSLLAGSSAIVCGTSLVWMLWGTYHDILQGKGMTTTKFIILWFLAAFSFGNIISLVAISLQKAQG